MSLKPLITNQTIKIDDHGWGAGEVKEWDNPANDIHVDKTTKSKYEGKNREIRIKIPINNDREIEVTAGKNELDGIPRHIKKEILKAFGDAEVRREFIKDIIAILDNYASNLDSLEKARAALQRLSKHFELNWTEQEIQNYLGAVLIELRRIYKDNQNKLYHITIDRVRIRIGEIDRWEKWRMKIQE